MPPGSARPSTGSDIHPITEDVVVLNNDVTLVNADPKLDPIIARFSGI
jgi:hypothetical protein